MRLVRTRRGFRLVQGGLVWSEVLDHPGPTHTLFDVLAGVIAACATGPRVAILGFAAGGLVAPLRAMGFTTPLEAVDLDAESVALFRHTCDAWSGEVKVAQADAVEWISRSSATWDLVLDDLSVETEAGVTKPRATWERLPQAVARRLSPTGIAVVNLLPVPGMPWTDLVDRVATPWRRKRVILLEDYENRIVVAGRQADSAAVLSRRLRARLRAIGSRQATKVVVRAV